MLQGVRKKRVLLLLHRSWAKRITYLGNLKSVEKYSVLLSLQIFKPLVTLKASALVTYAAVGNRVFFGERADCLDSRNLRHCTCTHTSLKHS